MGKNSISLMVVLYLSMTTSKPDTPEDIIKELIRGVEAQFIFIGHSHLPFVRKVEGVTLVNPGSVGQPRDEDTRASWCRV